MRRRTVFGFSASSIAARLVPGLAVAAVLIASFIASPATHLFGSLAGYGYGACGYGYGYTGSPSVSGISPKFGPTAGGTTVTVTGSGFCNDTFVVKFGATASVGLPNVVSDSQITATSPAEAAGTVDVRVTTAGGTSLATAADHFTFLPAQPGIFKPKTPHRLLDTRSSSPLGPGGSATITVAGANGVPANATAAVLNVTATNTSAFSWLTCWPAGQPQPTASSLNWTAGVTVANLIQVQLGGGQVTCKNAGGTMNLIVDLEGDYEPQGAGTDGGFVQLSPSRITDTRTGSGKPNAGLHLGPNGTLNIQVAGAGGVPGTGAEAVVFNATVTNTTALSWLTCWPAGQAKPTASNQNWPAGRSIAGRVIVMLGTGGSAGMVSCNNAAGTIDLIVDVNGYFTDATGSGAAFVGVAPNRDLDTRNGIGGFLGLVGPGQTVMVTVAGVGGVPAMGSSTPPVAVAVNVTATDHPAGYSWLTVWPNLTGQPLASDVNFYGGQTICNHVVVTVGTDGNIEINNAGGSTDIIVDVTGYYAQTS